MNTQRSSLVITGASGLLGTAVIKRLAHEFQIFALDVKEPPADVADDVIFVHCDVTDQNSINDAVAEVQLKRGPIASVIHLAAYYDFAGEPSDLYEEVTVRGTERLLRALEGVKVEQFIFSSTMLVHQPTEPGNPITEQHPVGAKWDYPQSKIDTEKVIEDLHADIPAVILRIAGVYTDEGDSIPIAHQIQRIYENRLTGHVFPGDTDRGQAFVHIDDLVHAIELAIRRRDQLGPEAAYLIGEPETYSYETLQRTIAQLVHDDDDWGTQQIPKEVARGGAWIKDKIPGLEEPFIKPWMIDLADDHYELDVSKAAEDLGWTPKRRLIDTLPTIIARLEADPGAWYERHALDLPEELEKEVASSK